MIEKEEYVKNVADKHAIYEVTQNNGIKLCKLATVMNMVMSLGEKFGN